ncbi:hypothetical protein ABZ345_23850 [Lentzea sp. NPDC005914]|uniref:hypothetical protein n=1 Tax=Lentzea sp. NPDC005914 TaxID=3154572 RepID=UPI0033D988D8
MIDRGKIAAPLVLVGAGLAVVSSFMNTYGSGQVGEQNGRRFTTSLWIQTSKYQEGASTATYYGAGWPVVITAVAMVVGVVLMARGRTAHAGRLVTLTAAGGLAGVVLFYVLQLWHEEATINESWPASQRYEVVLHEGTYLLIAAVIIGLVGAVLAQKREEPAEQPEEEVVVHQLDSDDDTPPFGIAIAEQEQEAR